MLRRSITLALTCLLAAPAAAQPAEGSVVRQEGEYGGVSPGEPPETTEKGKARPPARKTLLWIGFTPRQGGLSELFFQAAEPFEISQRMEGKTLVIVLEGLKAMARNTRRPLDTRFFDTALARVTARRVSARRARKGSPARPAGVEVRVAFKDPSDAAPAKLRTETVDGLFYAYLAFPPSSVPGVVPERANGPSMQDPEAE